MFSKMNFRRVAALLACLTIAGTSVSASAVKLAPVTNPSTSGSGTVRTMQEIEAAKTAIAAKQAAEEAAQKAAEEAAKQQAAQQQQQSQIQSQTYYPTYLKTIAYSSSYVASDLLKSKSTLKGNFKLTFYCPCSSCSGGWGGSTSSGVRAFEGRTIAVDKNVIPIGSKVYIEGFGDFIAEDVGGAIKGNRIDIFVENHSRCQALGVKYANVYVMN